MNQLPHINTSSSTQPIHSQQMNHNLLLQRQPNSQGQVLGMDQAHHPTQMQNIQQQQHMQQLSPYPSNSPQLQNLSSSNSSSSTAPHSSQRVINQNIQYIQGSSQPNKNLQPQLQAQSEGYIHHHSLQNQQVQQMQQQQPNQINQQQQGGSGQGGAMIHGQQLSHHQSQQPQQQQQQQQHQGQLNYQVNQNPQQGMVYAHQSTGIKQPQLGQPSQPQMLQQQQPQQYPQQDSRRNSSRSDKNSSSVQLNGQIPAQPQQPSLVFSNQAGICSDKDGPFAILEQFVEPIYEDFVYLTEKILDKTMKSANKQLQDTLMNYFLENHVSNLIIKEMNCISKRAVRYEIEKTMQKNKTAKYMNLLNAFEAKVKQFGKEKAYENLLMQLITDENSGSKQSEQWKTLVRKRILALLLFIHWQTPNAENIFNDFFAIWDLIYPNHPLPQKVKKQATTAGGSGSQISSQLAFSNHGQQHAEKPVNPNKTMKRSKQKIIDNMNLSQASLTSQTSNNNSQSTSLFQHSYGSTQQNPRTSKEQKLSSSQNQTAELSRSSVKSEKDSQGYPDINQNYQQGPYQQQQMYSNQRNQMYLPNNQQQNPHENILPLQSSTSAFYPSQGTQQQYDYTQNYYGNQQGTSPSYDQNYLIPPPQSVPQPQGGVRPSNQVFKGRMRSQSWDDPGYKREEYNSPLLNPQNNNLINQQQQGGYFNQQQPTQSTFYQQANQQYGYDQQDYYDPNLNQQYSHPSLGHQSSSGYYVDYQGGQQQQSQLMNRNQSNSVPQSTNDPNSQIPNQNYGYAPNQHYQNQQQYQNPNYSNNYSNAQYQQVQKIPFYQNNIYDIQEVKQEGTPSSQNTQESNNNQFFHMDKIVLPDPESPDQRLKRGSQQATGTNFTPQNQRPRYSLQYNQLQQGQQDIMQYHQQQQQAQNKNLPPQQQYAQIPPVQPSSGQKGQYDQSGNKYQQMPINNTKQEEDLYSSSSQQYNGSNNQQQSQRSTKANKNYDSSNSESAQSMKNKNGSQYIGTKQEEVDVNTQDQTNDNNEDRNANEVDQVDYKEKKRNTIQNPQQVQQQTTTGKGKDKRLSSPSVLSQAPSIENPSKLQQIQLHPTQQQQQQQQGTTLQTSDGSVNKNKAQEKTSQPIYQQETINEDEKDNDMSRSSNNVNVSTDQYYQSQSDQGDIPPATNSKSSKSKGQSSAQNSENNNQNAPYASSNKESTQVNNGLFQDYQNNEDQYLNIPNQNPGTNNMILSNDDKFIRNSQRQNTGASCMSIESEKTPFKRSDTRNMTGLSNISIESDKDGRTPTYINRSKFFFRHQNSLEFPPVIGVRSNARQGTAISNISDGLGAAEMLGSQTNIHNYFKRNNFKQFSGISHISIEGGEYNYLQMMQTSNQSQNFGNISRSQLRKRTNLSVDSLASFNIKPDKDIQNLSFDLENLSLHNQQIDNNGQILPQDAVNEGQNILDDKQTNNIFQYNYSPTNNEILP